MISVRVRWLFVFAVCLQRRAEGAVSFTVVPTPVFYYPPAGFGSKLVVCATNESASIVWKYVDGTVLDPSTYHIEAVSSTRSQINLTHELIVSSFAAAFLLKAVRCEAGNVMSSEFVFQLGVAPSVSKDPANFTVNETDTATFECTFAETVPEPTVTWIFTSSSENKTLKEETRGTGTRDSVLLLSDVTRADDGAYRCVVKNEFKSVQSSPGHLTVQYFGPITLENSPRLTVTAGETGIIDCKAQAFPAPTELVLSRSDGPFLSSSNLTLTGSSLGSYTVREPEHLRFEFTATPEWNGTVTCSGRNLVGSDESVLSIIFQTPPAPPKFCVNETKPSTHSIKYSFQLGDDGQSPITEVTVSCYKVKSDNELDTSVEYKQTTSEFNSPNCTISEVFGLIPGTEYGCMLRARNGVDLSDPSDRFDQTTVTAAPAKPVLNPIAMEIKEESLEVQWTVAYNGGEPITEYIIHWGTHPDRLVSKEEIKNPSSQTQGTQEVTGLKGGTEYFVQIEAKNDVGSNKSLPQSYTTDLCLPPMPTNVTSTIDGLDATYTMIKLKLILPQDTLCSPIAAYIVKDSSTGVKLLSSHSINNRVVTITVSGLREGTQYELTVSFNNSKGNVGSASIPVTFTTDDGAITTEPVIKNEDDGGGLSTGVIIGIAVGCAVAVIVIIVIIVCVCIRMSSEKESSVQVQTYTLSATGGSEEKDTHVYPGPNSGSTYSPRKKEYGDKETSGKVVYTEVDVGDDERQTKSTPKRTEPVEYAAIDREATRKRREEKEAEMKRDSKGEGDGEGPGGLSSLV